MAKTKIPAIYKVPAKLNPDLKRYLESVQEALEVGLGRRGDELDQAVTFRDLIDTNIAQASNRIDQIITPTPTPVTPTPTTYKPPTPTGFTAHCAFTQIMLGWDMPNMPGNFEVTEIYRNTIDDVGSATLLDSVKQFRYTDAVDYNETWYYWIRFVSNNAAASKGPFSSVASCGTKIDIGEVLDELDETLADLPGYAALNSALGASIQIIQASGVPDENTNRANGDDPLPGDLYVDTATSQVYLRNADDDGWIEAADASVVNVLGTTSFTGSTLSSAMASAQSTIGTHTTDIAANAVSISNLDTVVTAKVDVYRAATEPTGGTYVAGDLWFDTDDYHMYQWNGSAWVSARDQGLATSTALSGVSSTASNAATAASNAATAASNAATAASNAQGTANTATNTLADIADDDKLTPSEKQQAKTLWDAVATEYAGIVASALATTSTSSSAYTTAYNNLNTYLNTTPDVFDDMDVTTTISRTTWNARWVAYYDAKQALLDAIAAALKVIADAGVAAAAAAATAASNAATAASNAATAATNAQGELDDIAADDKVTPVEKLQAKVLWDAIYAEKPGIVTSAGTFSVSSTNYVADYDALNTFLNTTPDIFDDMDATTTITRATWDTRWKDYYDEKQTLLDAIAAAAKVLADNAQATANAKITCFNQGRTTDGIPGTSGGGARGYADGASIVKEGDIWVDTDALTTILKGGTFATSAVTIGTDTIDLTTSQYNALSLGDSLVYSNGGGTTLAGLTSGETYYVIKGSTPAIKVALSHSLAIAGTAIDLTGTGNNAQSLTDSVSEANKFYIAQADGSDAIAANEWVTRDNANILSAYASVTSLSKTTADLAGNASASHVLQVNANGHVAGISLYSGTTASGQVSSDIILQADRILFTNSSGATPTAAFAVVGDDVFIRSAYIQSGSITTAHISNATIQDAQITSLSATKLDAGTITTETIKIGASTGARIDIDGAESRIVVIDAT